LFWAIFQDLKVLRLTFVDILLDFTLEALRATSRPLGAICSKEAFDQIVAFKWGSIN